MKTLDAYLVEIFGGVAGGQRGLVQDQALDIADDDRVGAIARALERFSRARPRIAVADVVGTGAADYTPPAGWVEQWSAVKSIEHPIGNVPATYLEDGDFEIYQTPTAEKIRLRTLKPTASQSFRVAFTALHTVTLSAGTVGDGDFGALCHLAASVACQMLANKYSQSSEPTLSADSVDHKSKAFEFKQRSQDLYKIYAQHIGASSEMPAAAASTTQDWDKNFSWGEDRLTHPRRRR